MAEEVTDEVYTGTVKKLSKDGSKYIIECLAVSTWYGVDARLPTSQMPEGLEIGHSIRFSLSETGTGAPMASWAEKVPQKSSKRKAEEPAEPADGEELYVGTLRKSNKDLSVYIVECPVVTSWYGCQARASADILFLAGAGAGDEILFSLKHETEAAAKGHHGAAAGQPWVAWAERADSASAKKRLKGGSGPGNAKAKAAGVPKPGVPKEAGATEELERLKEQLNAERMAKLEAQLEAERAKAAAQKAELEQLRGHASGPALSRRHSRPADDSSEEPARHPAQRSFSGAEGLNGKGKGKVKGMDKGKEGKGKGKAKGKGKVGELRFASADDALAALALYGTHLLGAEVRPEAHPKEGTVVRVPGLCENTSSNELKAHFQEVGEILKCTVQPEGSSKGAGKAGRGKGEGKAAGVAPRGGTSIGEVRFQNAEGAEAALGLYGSMLANYPEHALRVELDARSADGTKVKVFGLPEGVPHTELRAHFVECGDIAHAKVHSAQGVKV